jgi:hypothetical protein
MTEIVTDIEAVIFDTYGARPDARAAMRQRAAAIFRHHRARPGVISRHSHRAARGMAGSNPAMTLKRWRNTVRAVAVPCWRPWGSTRGFTEVLCGDWSPARNRG